MNKRILLIIGGGIAAYKSLEIIRKLKDLKHFVDPVITKAGQEFITPLSASTIANNKAHTELFDLTSEMDIGHIELARKADIIVVAPATADIIAKMSSGHANDLSSTLLLAADKPIIIAPAMNVKMWENPATRRNIATLKHDGIHIVGPEYGVMACAEEGFGRLAPIDTIVGKIEELLGSKNKSGVLIGKKALITAGGTREPIDPVRYIGNRSSGKQGYAIANELVSNGADVTLISGITNLKPDPRIKYIEIETAEQMLEATITTLPVDIAIFAAAVADWRSKEQLNEKMKKSNNIDTIQIDLEKTPDILHTISNLKQNRPKLVIGFAAETENILQNARNKLDKKGCNMLIANDVSPQTEVMGGDYNSIYFIDSNKEEEWPKQKKEAIAKQLAAKIAEFFTKQ